jgi:hypothetical protein
VPAKTLQNGTFSFLNRTQLIRLKLKAMRSGVWFRALPRIDRALVDLTIKVASIVRSVTLAKSLLAVVRKLEGIMESRLSRALREVGFPLAQKLSLQAQKWGNRSASQWAGDFGFARYLAITQMNTPRLFQV